MTSLDHVRFHFTLTLLSDAHIGTGEVLKFSELRPGRHVTAEDGAETDPFVSVIARDDKGQPILPATALKGSLRKAFTALHGEQEAKRLFGSIGSVDKEEDRMGRFSFYAGCLKRDVKAPSVDDLPYWDGASGTWIATHVALSRAWGTADPKKLYNREMLPAGFCFQVDGIWFGPKDEAVQEVPHLLALLAAKDGLQVGSGNRTGQGALSLDPNVGVTLHPVTFDPEKEEVIAGKAVRIKCPPPVEADPVDVLRFHCPGPFCSSDPSRKRHGDNRGNVIPALRRNEQTPYLHTKSLLGAMRDRAAWLSEWNGLGGDDRFRTPDTWETPHDLSPCERLFGVAGWRGLLRFSAIRGITGTPAPDLPGIALDKFSGAVLDSTLFAHEIFCDVRFEAKLFLDRRTWEGQSFPTEGDSRLLDTLLDDLGGDVLMLGHAVNRGFGWFDVTRTKAEAKA